MLKVTQYLLAVCIIVGLGYFGYRYWQVQQLAKQYDAAAEIAKSSISKDGATWTIHMESIIPKPIDAVWGAMKEPQRSAELSPNTFRRSEVKKEEGNKKTVEFQVGLLSLPVQTLLAEMSYDDGAKRLTVSTTGGMQKIDATYTLESKGAEETWLRYDATAVDQVSLPIPQAAVEGALKEFFVQQVRLIKRATGAAKKEEAKADTGPTGVGSICTGDVGKQNLKQITMTIVPASAAPAPAGQGGEYRNQTEQGYERGYVVEGNAVKETFDKTTRCTTATAVVGGKLLVRVESVILSPDSLEVWVKGIDWKTLATLAPEAGDATLRATLPEPSRGWQVVSPIDPPPFQTPLVHHVYQQGLF